MGWRSRGFRQAGVSVQKVVVVECRHRGQRGVQQGAGYIVLGGGGGQGDGRGAGD